MFLLDMFNNKLKLPDPGAALPGRPDLIDSGTHHFVSGNPLHAPYPDGMAAAMFGLGCFWGAERKFWELDGVYITAAGYAAGSTPNPTYKEVCSGLTGHNEVVRVVFDPKVISFAALLKTFWECHNPTQGMQQGNDVGTQYRSGIYACSAGQLGEAQASKSTYQQALDDAGVPNAITTEIIEASEFYFAEEYHQQYLAKNPDGYCGLGGTGIACPAGVGEKA